MLRHILGASGILGLLASSYGLLYEPCKERLFESLSRDHPYIASILCAALIGVGVLGVTCLFAGLIALPKLRTLAKIRKSGINQVDAIAEPVETVERECMKLGRFDARGRGEVERLLRVVRRCNDLAKADDVLERKVQKYPELRPVRTARQVIVLGLGRAAEVLGNAQMDARDAIVRTHEGILDIRVRHLPQFREALNAI